MDAEIIVIFVAVGLSILSGINKNKKKKAHRPESASQSETDIDDPWSSIRRYIEEAQHENTKPEYEDREHIQVVPEEKIYAPTDVNTTYISSLDEYAKRKSLEADKNPSRIKHVSQMPLNQPETTENVLEGFDLRKAVLYSEILRPKYEEI